MPPVRRTRPARETSPLAPDGDRSGGSAPARAEHRWVQDVERADLVEQGGPAAAAGGAPAGRDEEAWGARDLAVEVARIEAGPPDGLVDLAQLGDGEGRWAEAGRERGVLQLRASALDAVG